MRTNIRVPRDFARTIGDAFLGHLYRGAGGDGRRNVRIEPYRAAVFLTGDSKPPRLDVRHANDVLYVLLDTPTREFSVTRCPDVEGAYLIQPRSTRPAPAR